MVTRVTGRVVADKRGGQVLLLGKLGEHWLHWGRVPVKRSAAIIGC